MRRHFAVVLGVLFAAVACGGSTPPTRSPPAEPGAPKAQKQPPEAPPDGSTSQLVPPSKMPSAQPVGKQGPSATGMNETTDVAPGQCADLEKILTKLVFDDLMAKVPDKLEPAQREQQEKKIAEMAKQTAAQFGDSCYKNMVGKAIQRQTLDCMFKAKTFQGFEGCSR